MSCQVVLLTRSSATEADAAFLKELKTIMTSDFHVNNCVGLVATAIAQFFPQLDYMCCDS